ncbi:MAG TPA: methyltransferase [Vicinamibacterales bacterium]|nr:methyltransferase [Vicinamibacterales bacterium]
MADLTTRVARLRVPLGFLFAILVLWLAQPSGASLAAGSVVAAVGELLRIWAAGHLNKSREVTSSGPYRWFAHPLYVGSAILGVGLAIAAGSAVVAALIAVYLGSTIAAAVRSEEAFLRRKFGDRYDVYRRGAPGARDAAAATRRFTVRQAMANREYRAVSGVVLAVLLLCLKAAYNGTLWRIAGAR